MDQDHSIKQDKRSLWSESQDHPQRLGWRKLAYLAVGWVFLLLAVLGALLPILPTTPFALVSAFCFSRSSRRLYDWCLNLPVLGPAILDWQKHRAIRPKAKVSALIAISAGLVFIWAKPGSFIIKAIVTSILFGIIVLIITRKSF